jgi:hypothetical protein
LTLVNLSAALFYRRDYKGSEQMLVRAVAIDENALGPNHPATKNARENLADFRERMKSGK